MVSGEQDLILFFGPLYFGDERVEVVVPTLPALLAQPILKMRGDFGPVPGTADVDQGDQQLILRISPIFLGFEDALFLRRDLACGFSLLRPTGLGKDVR